MSDTNNFMICPVCGRGTMVHDEQGWKCSEQSCGFVIPNRVFNLEMTEELVTLLVKHGHTGGCPCRTGTVSISRRLSPSVMGKWWYHQVYITLTVYAHSAEAGCARPRRATDVRTPLASILHVIL